MRFWLPYVRSGSGSDVFTRNLAAGLHKLEHEVAMRPLPRLAQMAPDLLRAVPTPGRVDAIVTNSSIGFAFANAGVPMVTVAHHSVHDPVYARFRTRPQTLYHEFLLKSYERRSFGSADETVAVSMATRRGVMNVFPDVDPRVIRNGVDTTFFTPEARRSKRNTASSFRMLFVGNLTTRKGVDLLEPTMRLLGPRFILEYTSGLRGAGRLDSPNARRFGRLSMHELREAYRQADALFLPSRLEGGPLVAFEAMACGLPVVAANLSAMPEVVLHGQTGLLCDLNPAQFATAFRRLADDRRLLSALSAGAREYAAENLSIETMTSAYVELFNELIEAPGTHDAET